MVFPEALPPPRPAREKVMKPPTPGTALPTTGWSPGPALFHRGKSQALQEIIPENVKWHVLELPATCPAKAGEPIVRWLCNTGSAGMGTSPD